MERIMKCAKFQFVYLIKSLLIFLAIYFGIYLAIVLLITNVILADGGKGSFDSSFYMGAAIFGFVTATTTYKHIFNNLLMFGNTRRNIAFSSFITYTGLSAVFAVISAVALKLDVILAGTHYLSRNILNILYPQRVNMATELLWFLLFFAMLFAFSILFGALSYKFGKPFIRIFWIGFSILFIFVPMVAGEKGLINLINAIDALFCAGNPDGILLAPVNFAVFTLIFGAAAYLIASKQSQNA